MGSPTSQKFDSATHSKTILIAADDLANVYLFRHVLRENGIEEIVSVGTGEEAAQYVAGLAPFENRRLPNLIFLDLEMRGIDVIASVIRSPLFKRIPIIAVSNSPDPAAKSQSAGLRTKKFVQKTAELAQLKANIDAAMNLVAW